MKQIKYIGTFKNSEGHQYQLEVYAQGFLQALILLTADAIRRGKHYQLKDIDAGFGDIRKVADISKISDLLS